MEEGRRRTPGAPGQETGGIGMLVLRAWMWFVPAALLIVSVAFSAIAAADSDWALLAAMLLMGLFAIALLALHWWLLYRFGGRQETGDGRQVK